MHALGDAGSDELYSGEVSDSPFSMDYFRTKITEFQSAINLLDSSYRAGKRVYDETGAEEIAPLLEEYQAKLSEARDMAQTLNFAAETVNALGGRAGIISIPQTLGFAPAMPLVLTGAAVAAVTAIAAWSSYSAGYSRAMTDAIATVRQRVSDPAQAAKIEAELRTLEQSQTSIALPFAAGFSGTVKFIAVAVVGYMAWKAYKEVSGDD